MPAPAVAAPLAVHGGRTALVHVASLYARPAAATAVRGTLSRYSTGFTVGSVASILAGKNPVVNGLLDIYDHFAQLPMPMSDPLVRPKLGHEMFEEILQREFSREEDYSGFFESKAWKKKNRFFKSALQQRYLTR